MSYTIALKPRARRDLAKLPKTIAERMAQAIDGLASEPRPSGCKKLASKENLWRIRVGDYRVVYTIEDARRLVVVVTLGHRRDVYRD